MKHIPLNTLFVGLLAILGGTAVAADIANVKIIANGQEQAVEVDLDQLKVGESRQLVSASGAPAVVTRDENGLSIEIAGRRTEVKLGAVDVSTWHADAGDGKVKVIEIDRDDLQEFTDQDGQHKVMIVRKHKGDADAIDESEIAALIAEVEADVQQRKGEAGEDQVQVVVTRKISHDETH